MTIPSPTPSPTRSTARRAPTASGVTLHGWRRRIGRRGLVALTGALASYGAVY